MSLFAVAAFVSSASSAPGPAARGYELFDPEVGANWGDYTFRLAESPGYDVEALRPLAASIVDELNRRSGSAHLLAPGTAPTWTPGPGEIIVRISSDCPVPTAMQGGGQVLGCGGPFARAGDSWTSGRATVTPEGLATATLRGTLAHEIGHALGLGHSDATVDGHDQLMRDEAITGRAVYGEGDLAGLRGLLRSARALRP